MEQECEANHQRQIEICPGGPYIVTGGIPLVRKIQVVSEFGEPLHWQLGGEIPTTDEGYFLCRCGQSADMPFCDGTHCKIHFDGKETAPTNSIKVRQETYPGCKNIIIRMDPSICTSSGFCANRNTTIAELAWQTADAQVRAMAIGMIQNCPSGALTYILEGGTEDIELDLPQEIVVTTEVISEGAIRGPLWITGGIPIIRADGEPFEIRNRVTLCSCGHSQIMPLCDGSHREYPVFLK